MLSNLESKLIAKLYNQKIKSLKKNHNRLKTQRQKDIVLGQIMAYSDVISLLQLINQ